MAIAAAEAVLMNKVKNGSMTLDEMQAILSVHKDLEEHHEEPPGLSSTSISASILRQERVRFSADIGRKTFKLVDAFELELVDTPAGGHRLSRGPPMPPRRLW